MAMENHPFYSLWAQGDIRDRLMAHLSKADICAVRLSNSACCNLVTRKMFQRIHLTFTPNSFTRPYKVEALARIGQHVEHLTFYMPHGDSTFLPPLIHPATGAEISYLYTPHTSMASTLTRPKYGNSELGDILTQQYPPLFHASTNVPSFINAVKHLPNLRHLTIKTPGQNPAERYRRDIVDYALMSLRIAIERSPYLTKLSKLSLHQVHPAAFLYLKFQDGPGFGCSPNAGKRWRQIRKMHIAVESWDFYGPSGPGLDQLKIMDDYLRQFTGTLEKLSFAWVGRKGPCPLALAEDPLFDTPRENKKLFNEVTSPMSPLPPRPGMKGRMQFRKLKYLSVRNSSMHAAQLRGLVEDHRETVKEFDFENVVLHNGGNWDEALAPLMAPPASESARDTWARYSVADDGKSVHSVQTPRTDKYNSPVLPDEAFNGPLTCPSRHSLAQDDEVTIRHQSAAVAAVGKELLDFEVEQDVGDRRFSQTSSSDRTIREESFDDGESYTYYDDEVETIIVELDEDIDSAINLTSTNGSQTTLPPFSTKLKKRVRKRRRKPWHPKQDETDEDGPGLSLQPTKSNKSLDKDHGDREKERERPSLRKMLSHKKSDSSTHTLQTVVQVLPPAPPPHQPNKLQKPPPAPIEVYPGAAANRTRQSSDPIPYVGYNHDAPTSYELPLVISEETLLPSHSSSSVNRTTQWPRPRAASEATTMLPPPSYPAPAPPTHAAPPVPGPHHSAEVAPLDISAPIISTEALPVLLQPMVYSPTAFHPNAQASTASIPIAMATALPGSRGSGASGDSGVSGMSHLNKTFSNNGGGHNVNDGLSAVQRNLEQEETQRRFAEDAEARTSALKRAREAVLEKLGRLQGGKNLRRRKSCWICILRCRGMRSSCGSASGVGARVSALGCWGGVRVM
ncbi:hypothetical protein N0V93_000064 [Gnomoniopsis smithogilvyi]|uniref:Uncharacterized protein n=1 Tax=Gnomoniopsis smithogilvyi TaxID=1191159 RepID=A0A9W8Z176_9PEZI|nr:hypothetical protein N0V93_000064 [Gnomoniopsis smithogilvyi]